MADRASEIAPEDRLFLFLEGPHGTFFRRLAEALEMRGAAVHRVLFNLADRAEWGSGLPASHFTGAPESFADWLAFRLEMLPVTDIVVYGDTRPVHRTAIELARARHLRVHILEEGYLRPRFVSYERQGANAASRICHISLPRMAEALGPAGPPDYAIPGDNWGDSRQHRWQSGIYHWRLLRSGRPAMRLRGGAASELWPEIGAYLSRALALPAVRLRRWARQSRLKRSGRRYHLVLLQLSFDASLRDHSDYADIASFIEEVVDAFAEGAPADHVLVFKAHPFDNGRAGLGRLIRTLCQDLGIGERVLFLDGGQRLAPLMDGARSVVTVNSTGAQQALWRGLPVLARGRAIYRKPGLASEQSPPQ
ncbi:MAG: capsule biosynthesis protein CapA, partial [Pseudomonadota bacterium]